MVTVVVITVGVDGAVIIVIIVVTTTTTTTTIITITITMFLIFIIINIVVVNASKVITGNILVKLPGSVVIEDLVKVLESYRGKDRTIRLFTYVFMYLGGRGNTPLQAKFRKLVSELGGCRVVLRLFDDFSMLMLNLSTGSLVKLRICAMKTLSLKKQKYLEKTEDREIDSQQNQQIDEKMTKLALERRDLILLIIQSAADLTNAISWLPKGFLWSQKLHPSANGICGLCHDYVMDDFAPTVDIF
nr:hypothetical protein BaRGS_016057 [Batillaria attramentaria]